MSMRVKHLAEGEGPDQHGDEVEAAAQGEEAEGEAHVAGHGVLADGRKHEPEDPGEGRP
jgi:hypothetical protein